MTSQISSSSSNQALLSTVTSDPIPTVTLASGLRIANHSSAHSVEFSDGSTLPACSKYESDIGAPYKRVTDRSIAPGRPGRVTYYALVGGAS